MSYSIADLNQIARETLKEKLSPGEEIQWCGAPVIKLLRFSDIIAIPFSTVWTSIAVVFFFTAVSRFSAEMLPFLLMSGAFLCIGLYITVGRFIHEYLFLKNCLFVITNQNAYQISRFPFTRIKAAGLAGDKPVIVRPRGKLNDIVFGELPEWEFAYMANVPAWQIPQRNSVIFFNLDNTSPVTQRLRNVETKTPSKLTSAIQQNVFAATGACQSKDIAPSNIHLLDGEKIIWQGKPEQGYKFRKTDPVSIVIFLIYSWLLQFPISMFLGLCAPGFAASGIVFAALLILVMVVSVVGEYCIKSGFVYTLTNKRVMATLQYSGAVVPKRYSLDLQSIQSIEVSNGDESGIITFNRAGTPLYRIFGPDAIMLSPKGLSERDPFLLDVPKARSIAKMIEQQRDALLKEKQSESTIERTAAPVILNNACRSIPPGLSAKMLFCTEQAKAVFFVFVIVGLITTAHFFGYGNRLFSEIALSVSGKETQGRITENSRPGKYNESKVEYQVSGKSYEFSTETQEEHKIGDIVSVKYSPIDPSVALAPSLENDVPGFPPVMFLGPLAFFGGASALLVAHIKSVLTHLHVLREGAVASEARISSENVVCQTNGRPSICRREYSFVDANGVLQTTVMFVGANSPRPDKATVLFDPVRPVKAVILDELPGKLQLVGNEIRSM